MNTQIQSPAILQIEKHPFPVKSLRRVLLAGCADLLEEGLARLLNTRQDLEVLHVECRQPDDLALSAAQFHPDVIVLCQVDAAVQDSLPALLDDRPGLAAPVIIIVHLQNVELGVYQSHHWFSTPHTAFFPLIYGQRI